MNLQLNKKNQAGVFSLGDGVYLVAVAALTITISYPALAGDVSTAFGQILDGAASISVIAT